MIKLASLLLITETQGCFDSSTECRYEVLPRPSLARLGRAEQGSSSLCSALCPALAQDSYCALGPDFLPLEACLFPSAHWLAHL